MRQTDDIPGEIAQARSCARRACIQALLAAAAQALAGNTAQATARAAHVRERGPLISSVDFFRGYPVKAEPMRTKIANALQGLGF